jgi:hypothetical protein
MITLDGLRIIEDASLVDVTEDWSRVRAPSRAERRRRQGHRQNIAIVGTPKPDCFVFGNNVVMHPVIAAKFRAATTPDPRSPSASTSGPGNLRGGAAASPLFNSYVCSDPFRSSPLFKVTT